MQIEPVLSTDPHSPLTPMAAAEGQQPLRNEMLNADSSKAIILPKEEVKVTKKVEEPKIAPAEPVPQVK